MTRYYKALLVYAATTALSACGSNKVQQTGVLAPPGPYVPKEEFVYTPPKPASAPEEASTVSKDQERKRYQATPVRVSLPKSGG